METDQVTSSKHYGHESIYQPYFRMVWSLL